MAEFEAYRSRRIIWVKPHVRAGGEQVMRTKDGKLISNEVFRHEWEKLDKPEKDAS